MKLGSILYMTMRQKAIHCMEIHDCLCPKKFMKYSSKVLACVFSEKDGRWKRVQTS
jgi:hypothetical protein